MSLNDVATATKVDRFLQAILKAHGRPRLQLNWEPGRMDILRRKVATENIAAFEKNCALGQLAAAAGDIATAESQLLVTLRDFRHLYPHNGHLFQHILQLALAMQALDLVALFLNDRHDTPDLFVVTFKESRDDPAINWVTVDDAGQCHFAVDPRIPGKHHADYFVAHWVSSAPLWASYCRSAGWEPGKVPMNSGEAGVIPGLAYCGNKSGLFLIPDGYFLGTRGYADLRAKYEVGRPKWDDRRPIAFWRGATTGVRTGRMDWQSLPRISLCRIARDHQNVLDAGLSGVVQTISERERQEIEAEGLVKGRVPVEAFLDFKYQIDIDGNTNAWPGLYQRLLSGSPVLKIASPHGYRQWYYGRLKPWINYVPVASDMTDLVEKIGWLRDHDDQARAIGQAGLELAKSLEYDHELSLAHNSIRGAFRWLQGRPESEISFRSERKRNENPIQRLEVHEADHAWASGGHTLLTVKRPASIGEYEFVLDLEPHTHVPEVQAQHVSVLIDDNKVLDIMLKERRNISWIVRDDIFGQRDELRIVILHPDGFPLSCYEPSQDTRPKSILVHSLSIKKAAPPDFSPAILMENAVQAVTRTTTRATSGRTIVYDDDELRVIWQPGTSEYLLITFGDTTMRANGDRIYADEPVVEFGLNCIGFIAKTRNWYPSANVQRAIEALENVLRRFSFKVAYGGSMGGYAAIKFSALLGVSETIAFCPQWSIDPIECGENRSGYGQEFQPFMTGMGIRFQDVAGRIWVLYDPSNEVDSFHYRKIESLGVNVIPVYIHMLDHHVPRVLAETFILPQVINACRKGNVNEVYQITHNLRRVHRIRRLTVLRKAAGRHPVLVLRALDALAAAGHRDFQDDDKFHFAIIESLMRRGEGVLAAFTIDRLSALVSPQRLCLLRQLGDQRRPKQSGLYPGHLTTCHKTVVVYDVFDATLRHVPSGIQGLLAGQYPVVVTDVDQRKVLTLRLEDGGFACTIEEGDQVKLLDLDTLGRDNLIVAEEYPGFFALRIGERYVCADREGRMAYNRQTIQAWEKFIHSVVETSPE